MNKFEVLEGVGGILDMEKFGFDRIGTDHYTSEEFYQRELNTIWRKCWLWAGRVSEIPNPGDYFVFRLPFLDQTSIIVVRGKDKKIRGFYNACTHRGGRLAYYEKGSCPGALTCTFHGWTFDLEGKLADVSFKETFGEALEKDRSLKEVSVDTWGDWVFVNLDREPKWTLAEYLAPLPQPLGEYFDKENWVWGEGRKGEFKCNWKLQVDSQSEGYHAPYLHGRSIMAGFGATDVPTWAYLGSPGVAYKLEVHRPNTEEGASIFFSDVARVVSNYNTALYYNTDSEYYRNGTDSAKYPGATNVNSNDRWSFDLYNIFPNTVIIVQNTMVLIMRSWPRGVDKTIWEYDMYFSEQPKNFGEHFARMHTMLELRNTITEDMTTVEGLHDSYKSGSIKELVISEPEMGVGAFERHVINMVNELESDM